MPSKGRTVWPWLTGPWPPSQARPPRDRGLLERALQRLAELLRDGPEESFGAIV